MLKTAIFCADCFCFFFFQVILSWSCWMGFSLSLAAICSHMHTRGCTGGSIQLYLLGVQFDQVTTQLKHLFREQLHSMSCTRELHRRMSSMDRYFNFQKEGWVSQFPPNSLPALFLPCFFFIRECAYLSSCRCRQINTSKGSAQPKEPPLTSPRTTWSPAADPH